MKKYKPQEIEQNWYQKWEAANYFAPRGGGKPYAIAIPPPNVTGTLHMGHAFQHALVDSIIRQRRMLGDKTLWQMGTDHAGISTQLLVTERLAKQGIKPADLGRDKFLDKVWEWKKESGDTINRQLRRLGASLHWETERFTLDEGLSRAVREVFVTLYDEGLIYKGKRLVNWDPVLRSSISDLEVEQTDESGHLWHFKYPIVSAEGRAVTHMIVATTRPETMLGDTAVAVHPDDERYKHLVGKQVHLPLTGRTIPIIADRYVDATFGTGCVKITPAHDFNDYDLGKRNNLDMINIMNDDASLNDAVPKPYRALKRYDARKKVLADLEQLGLLDKVEDHRMMVPRSEKSGAVIEPYLSDQWYVKMQPLAEPAIKAVADGKIEFIPKSSENTYFAWMRDIQDWCISRQQWWGHRIPAWYDADNKIYVGRDEDQVRAKYNLGHVSLRRDDDVLDTWFSSALWTFASLGWPDKTAALETFHATNLMVTGHDIITFWVSRMIVMSLKFLDEVPFKKVYVHGLVTDADGNKMSKSKGNGLDPLDIIDGIGIDALVNKRIANMLQPRMAKRIEKATHKEFSEGIAAYGADALRFTFYAIATGSRKIRFSMKRVEGYRNFCNKLWNAANFVFMHTQDDAFVRGKKTPSVVDRWITSRFQKAAAAVNLAMETLRFDLAASAIYEFIWDEFCDWYLELSKAVLNSDQSSSAQRRATQYTLLSTLEATLRLAHPFLPFMTEALWQQIPVPMRGIDSGARRETIMTQAFPQEDTRLMDATAETHVTWIKAVVTAARNIRGEMNISFARPIPLLFHQGNDNDKARLKQYAPLLTFLIKPEKMHWLDDDAEVPLSATCLVGDMNILVPMSGLIDKNAEITRLAKEIDKQEKAMRRAENKINNPDFISRAPSKVVDKERARVATLTSSIAQLITQRRRIESL